MSERDMEQALFDLVGEDFEVSTFEEAGLLTGNRGLILRSEDGSEFQLTIVQSR